MGNRHYITTAIDYPNAAPHMGHVLEKVLADVFARWRRLKGDAVRFQIGTDEHGIKIQQTAAKAGVSPQELVDRNVPLFQDLYARLGVSSDVFVRTTDREHHWPSVVGLWRRLTAAGALEKRTYSGLYCSGCERFLTKKDLVDGVCPDHRTAPQEVSEVNWFFLLSRFQDDLRKLLHPEDGSYRLLPEFRAEETRSLLEQGLEDVSFSRPVSSLAWGIPVPDEEGQTMYVWCDALTNYVSTLGYFTDNPLTKWWDGAEVTHVIGKDIARFHALIWPAMLQQAGAKTPDRLVIHGFLTSEGQKMSKSLGNVVVPDDVLSRYGVDALRFYLTHEVPVGNDGDFTWRHFDGVYTLLRNQVGNLLNRVLVMLAKEGGTVSVPTTPEILSQWDELDAWERYAHALDHWETGAIHVAMEVALMGNALMETLKPWTLKGEEKLHALGRVAELLRHASIMLLPFLPHGACRMAQQLGLPFAEVMGDKSFVLTDAMKEWGAERDWERIGEPSILFPPVEPPAA